MQVIRPAIALVALATGPAAVCAHEVSASGENSEPAVSFAVAIGLSTLLCLVVGFVTIARWRPAATDSHVASDSHGHGGSTRIPVAVLLLGLGLAALLSAIAHQWPLAVVGGVAGATFAHLGRTRGPSPHGGCADAAFGAILTHRVVEGGLVASIYVASTALGLLGLGLLTVHAIAETIAVGGLYAPLGRGWAVATVVSMHLGFVVGALFGTVLVWVVSSQMVTVLLAIVGGVLLVAGATEGRAWTSEKPRWRSISRSK